MTNKAESLFKRSILIKGVNKLINSPKKTMILELSVAEVLSAYDVKIIVSEVSLIFWDDIKMDFLKISNNIAYIKLEKIH